MNSFINMYGTIKLSVAPYGNTFGNQRRKDVRDTTQKTVVVDWLISDILPKDPLQLSTEKSQVTGKLIPSLAAEPSTVS